MTEASIKFFNILKCGYYLRGNELPYFGGIDDTFSKLNSWAKEARCISNTTCYQSDPDNDIHNTYFIDWGRAQDNGESILVLWNEIPNNDGVIYGMLPTQPPGGSSMLTTTFGNPTAIPGQPSYFWFLPSMNTFATIKFAHSMQGKTNLERYLNGFLTNKSPNCIKDANDNIIGFSSNKLAPSESLKAYPKFHAIGHKTMELESELLSNRHRIRKFVKREELAYTIPDDRSVIERTFSGLLPNPPIFSQKRSIMHEIQYQPSEAELRQIIESFSTLGERSAIQNAGFVYEDGQRIMLRGAQATIKTNLDVRRSDNQIITPNELLIALNLHRQNLLSPFREVGAIYAKEAS